MFNLKSYSVGSPHSLFEFHRKLSVCSIGERRKHGRFYLRQSSHLFAFPLQLHFRSFAWCTRSSEGLPWYAFLGRRCALHSLGLELCFYRTSASNSNSLSVWNIYLVPKAPRTTKLKASRSSKLLFDAINLPSDGFRCSNIHRHWDPFQGFRDSLPYLFCIWNA